MRTHSDKLRGKYCADLMKTKDREIIDISVKLTPYDRLHMLFREIMITGDDELIRWFEEKHIGDKIEQMIWANKPNCVYSNNPYMSVWRRMWERYGSRYRHIFYPSTDPNTCKLLCSDVIVALESKILSRRVFKGDVNNYIHVQWAFQEHGYNSEKDYYILRE